MNFKHAIFNRDFHIISVSHTFHILAIKIMVVHVGLYCIAFCAMKMMPFQFQRWYQLPSKVLSLWLNPRSGCRRTEPFIQIQPLPDSLVWSRQATTTHPQSRLPNAVFVALSTTKSGGCAGGREGSMPHNRSLKSTFSPLCSSSSSFSSSRYQWGRRGLYADTMGL